MIDIVFNSESINASQVCDLYTEVGWNKNGFRTFGKTMLAINNSLCHCAAYDTTRGVIVGFSRLVGDGVYVIQLVDLIVSKKYRKQGIAKNLVNSILAGYFNEREKGAVMLIDGSGIKNLYESLDFRSAPNEMVFYM